VGSFRPASVISKQNERDLSNNSDSARTTISSQGQTPSPPPATPAAPPTFLASTGAKVGGILLFGLGLGIIGALFLAASKRRRDDAID
jgi:LPXTG-motif cell wall-anchored protein